MDGIDGVVQYVDNLAPSELIAFAERLEATGHRALWLPDFVGRDLFVTAGFVLANTSRLHVATGIANVYGRDATAAAQGARTLAELYGGRFTLGLGVSHPPAAEARGHAWRPPVQMLRDYLEGIAAARVGSPEPEQRAPVYIAAHGPKLLALAAELADGANTYLMPPEHTRRAREILGADKALNVVLPCCLCDEPDRARQVARRGLAMYLGLPAYRRQWAAFDVGDADVADGGSDRLVDMLFAWGDVAAIGERVRAHLDAGATRVMVIAHNASGRGIDWPLLEALAPG